ncbi:endogenous retrovirus group K member 10 Gag polyprotein-like [Chiroxiphia lanceolata]|uniref:endogenous retrovirus group K member 10 Gag polyprotein-like n=1 Tax=Chiroxiphia lanceolata TaxID=296741 RepID=UPI0013CE477E|nr:endogenous retrovirus group K member 10 Gag polyprotein-like [Chiroxiphia lanceolata]
MGLTLSTSQKFVYRRLKDFIIEHGHPLDKKSAKALAKWLDSHHHHVNDDTTFDEWQKIGFQLWREGERGDRLAKKAQIAWRLVLMVLQHQMMSKKSGSNNEEADSSKITQESKENTDRDTFYTDTDTHTTDRDTEKPGKKGGRKGRHQSTQNGGQESSKDQDGGRARRRGSRRLNSDEEAGPLVARERSRREKRRRDSRPSPSRKPRGSVGGARAKATPNFHQDGCAHKARATEAYPACRHSNPDCHWAPSLPEEPSTAPDIWKTFREDAASAQDVEFLKAFPVYYEEGKPPEWRPISYPMLKDIKKAIVEYGLGAPFTIGLLESFFLAYTLIPFDVWAIMGGLLTTVQASVFEAEWRKKIIAFVNDKMDRRGLPPRQAVDMLYGEGGYTRRGDQAKLDPKLLDISKELALEALKKVADAYVPTPSFTMINQGIKESFTDFITRLKEAIARQVPQKECQEILFNKLVIEKANEDCQRALKLLKNPTLLEMIEACKNIGSQSHKARLLAAAFTGPNHCFECGEKGHFKKHCPRLSASTPNLPKTVCKRCGKGRHWTASCRSLTDINGEPLPPSRSRNLKRRVTFSSLPDIRRYTEEQSGNGEQSARGGAMTQVTPQLRSALRTASQPNLHQE